MGLSYWADVLDCGTLPRWAAKLDWTAGLDMLDHMNSALRDNDVQMELQMRLK